MKRLALATAVVAATPLLALTSQAATPPYTVKALTLTVTVAPEGVVGTTKCVVDADLYTPTGASRTNRVPAILATNGFGGSKADQAGMAKAFASRGYVVLSYSGLGFGADPQSGRRGSDCKITLDDREHDGAAASQLVDFLGGLKKADDGTTVDDVILDPVAHDGRHHAGDPRVGMVGGSYGGQIQFAAAGVDPRIDTIVPLITWNDLSYSLSPNNTSLAPGTVRYTTPGVEKLDWTTLFFSLGIADGLQGAVMAHDPTRLAPCPNFADQACQIKATMDTLGYADQSGVDFARHASVTSYLDNIRIPVLLGQGQADTLFPLREAAATYAALRARKVPVKMIWQQWGHSHGALPGEFDLSNPGSNYEGRVISAWFDYFLKGVGTRPAMDFSYYADWLDKGDASTAFVSVPSYPLPGTTTLTASGSALEASGPVVAGSQTFAAPGQAPLSYTETSALDQSQAVRDAPGTFGSFATGPLVHDVDVIGAPTAVLRLSSQTAQAATPGTMLVAFVKLYDVAPDGTVTLAHRLIAPIRVADLSQPVEVALPGIVHRFAAGHRIELVVALSDAAYKNNTVGQVVTLSTAPGAATTLTLPGSIDPSAFPAG